MGARDRLPGEGRGGGAERRLTGPSDPLGLFHPAVADWFREAFPRGPTEAQRLAWPRIAAREGVLLVSPTGTGKTLAAFLVALDTLLKEKLAASPRAAGLRVVYVSPLKALDNDVHRNLEAPRHGIRQRLAATGPAPEIRAAVRTGDTTAAARAAQVKRPPEILITTPESLYVMLTGGARRLFGAVHTVILDEVHSIAGTKRGSHLALTLERLDAAVAAAGNAPPLRIALSATVAPPERVAAFVGGTRPVVPLVVAAPKELDLTIASPASEFGKALEGSVWEPALDAIVEEIGRRKTTLVFCNNRRHAERIAGQLEERLGVDVPAHHGSISKSVREESERSLKAGALKALVATGSLELGIDVGDIEAVVQVGSPKGISRALQRVGRSGHLVGEVSRGRFVPLFLDDLFECAAIVEGMHERDVEETRPPELPLDVLAQQIVAEAVARAGDAEPATAGALFDTFRRAYPYRRLTRSLFDETLAMLSGKYPKERFAELAPKLVWDRATGRVTPLPAARLAALLDGGTIADRGAFRAVLPNGKTLVGELDEEFVYELREGEAFLLGSHAWRALEISHDRVVVEDATGFPAKLPFWKGEGLGRTPRLGERVGRLKRFVAERLDDPALPEVLRARCGAGDAAASAMIAAVRRERDESGGLASDRRVVFETFPNELGDPCILVRSVFGRGVNLPWSLALASVLREETDLEIECVASDDGILLRAPRAERELPLDRLTRLTGAEARERLLSDLPNSPLFGARFRENAQRALLLPRLRTGKRTPFWLQRLKARDLLMATRSLPDFPIVAETYRDCLKDVWEYDRLLALLDDMNEGRVERAVDARRSPSPAAAGLIFNFVAAYMYEWDAPKAEKGLHALAMNRELLGEVLGEETPDGLRPEAVAEAHADASGLLLHRRARSADELLLRLGELGDLTEAEITERCAGPGREWLAALIARGSVLMRSIGGEERLVAAEEAEAFDALALPSPPKESLDALIQRFFATRGPATSGEAAARYGLPAELVESSLDRLRTDGLVVRGRFGSEPGVTRWAGARLTESIRRRTIAILRREIRPVPPETYRAFLARAHGAAAGFRFTGPDAAERAVALLRGLPLPALAWEASILPARLAGPEPDALDALSARGLLVWRASGVKDLRAASLAFFLRGEGRLFSPAGPPDLSGLSGEARALHDKLALSGASFLADLADDGRIPDRELTELVLAGLVTGDGLRGLRELLQGGGRERKEEETVPRTARLGRRPGRASLRAAEARVSARLGLKQREEPLRSGRWSLLSTPAVAGEPMTPVERAEAWVRILLARWGVVRRDVVEREEADAMRWSDVAPVLARLEMRGELRRGEFVEGGGPVQYADEETVDALRRLRERPASPDDELAVVSGADPVVHGLVPPGERDELVALQAGRLLCRVTPDGALVLGAPNDARDRLLRSAFGEMQELRRRTRDPLGRPRRLTVTSVDGRPVVGSRLAPLLEAAGFTRDGAGYGWRAL